MDRSWLIDTESEDGVEWSYLFSLSVEEYTEDSLSEGEGLFSLHPTLTNVVVF